MKVAELREMDTPTLIEKVEGLREELFKLRLQWHANTLENPNTMRVVRKDIARMLTVLRERELAAALIEGEPNA